MIQKFIFHNMFFCKLPMEGYQEVAGQQHGERELLSMLPSVLWWIRSLHFLYKNFRKKNWMTADRQLPRKTMVWSRHSNFSWKINSIWWSVAHTSCSSYIMRWSVPVFIILPGCLVTKPVWRICVGGQYSIDYRTGLHTNTGREMERDV